MTTPGDSFIKGELSAVEYAAQWGGNPCFDSYPNEYGDGVLFYNYAAEAEDPVFLRKFLGAIDRTILSCQREEPTVTAANDIEELRALHAHVATQADASMATRDQAALTRKNEEFTKIDKLHELLRLALDDFDLAVRDGYTIEMHVWLSRRHRGLCFCCLAGATLRRLEQSRLSRYDALRSFVAPADCPADVAGRLYAINCLRTGQIYDAVNCLWGGARSLVGMPESVEVPRYDGNPQGEWRKAMESLVELLAKADV